jgi:hypothetical protein
VALRVGLLTEEFIAEMRRAQKDYEDKQMATVGAVPRPGSTGTEGPASPTRAPPPPPTPPEQVELPPQEPTDEELEEALEDVEADEAEDEAEDEGAGREDAETVPG